MNKKLLLLLVIAITFSACVQNSGTKWPVPTVESKPWTRWWWMGSAVDSANLNYNIQLLGEAGIGGMEITPIYGVQGVDAKYIDYLSPTWMSMLSFTKTKANEVGMKIDMNTGTGWPYGGTEVTIDDAATKAIFQKYNATGGKKVKLIIAVEDVKQKEVASLSRLMAYSDQGDKMDLTAKIGNDSTFVWDAPAGNWLLIALFNGKTLQKVKRAAPGGEGYVMNHFDATAVKHYLSKFDVAFTRNNTPFPNGFFNDSYEVYGADWSPTFLDEFEKRRGYKLEDYFPELLSKDSTDISSRVVSDYRQTMSDMLLHNFTMQWTDWAHGHGSLTRNQAHGSPANLIDLYAVVDIPECEIFGISDFDIPGLRKDSLIKKNDGDPVTLKLASSAAHIAGKKFTSAETFTWLTEHFRTSLLQCKPEIDQMFTSGVNHVYFHGTPYSPKEAAWPGWLFYASINMSPTNSMWRDAPAFFSYITRTQSFLQYGQPDNDLLVYFPVHDIWYEQRGNYYLAFAIHGLRELLPKFYQTVDNIRESGRDVDYISDQFIESATVENGKIKTAGGTTYKALVIPAVKFLPVETVNKLYELVNAGAKVIFVNNYPANVPGLKDYDARLNEFNKIMSKFAPADFEKTQISSLNKGSVITGKNYNELFNAAGISHENFITDFNGQCIRRKNDLGYHYFMTMLTDNPIDGWVPISIPAKSAMFFDPMTGKSGKASIRENNGKTEVYMQLSPGESIILKTFTNQDVKTENWKYVEPAGKAIPLKRGWSLTFVESQPTVKGTFDIDTLGTWTILPDTNAKINMGTARYNTTFTIDNPGSDEYLLDLGDVRESARVFVNDKEVSTLFAVPFKTYIGKYIKKGENKLEVEVTNLQANRIADYDRRGVKWRIFNEINFVDVNYQKTLYDKWETVPSGLLGPVTIREMKFYKIENEK